MNIYRDAKTRYVCKSKLKLATHLGSNIGVGGGGGGHVAGIACAGTTT